MKQTKIISFVESCVNVFIGIAVAILSQVIIFPFFDINVSLETNFKIAFWFTLVSLIRSYLVRRWFETKFHDFSVFVAGFFRCGSAGGE